MASRYKISQYVELTNSGIVVQHIELVVCETRDLNLECIDTFLRGHIKSEHFDSGCRQVAERLERSRSRKHSATLRRKLQGQ